MFFSPIFGLFAQQNQVHNPVFEPVFADPTVVFYPKEKAFYAYATQDNWADGKGSRLIPIIKSTNLVNWSYVGEALSEKPNWKNKGGIWAPDINYIHKKFYLYYSFSEWGDTNPGIGLAIAEHPEGPFIDQGKILDSKSIDVPNSIDPVYTKVGKQHILIWGSFDNSSNQGIHGIELNTKATAIATGARKFKIAAGDWEAPIIHYKDGYYYFFGSKGSCCEGANSQYHMLVARSRDIKGPYLDRQGKPITERGNGTLILKGNAEIAGPGHMSKIITDKKGKDWILLHGMKKEQAKLPNGTNRRALFLEQIKWKEGWPYIDDAQAHMILNDKPQF